jgi:hypothetical protein
MSTPDKGKQGKVEEADNVISFVSQLRFLGLVL